MCAVLTFAGIYDPAYHGLAALSDDDAIHNQRLRQRGGEKIASLVLIRREHGVGAHGEKCAGLQRQLGRQPIGWATRGLWGPIRRRLLLRGLAGNVAGLSAWGLTDRGLI